LTTLYILLSPSWERSEVRGRLSRFFPTPEEFSSGPHPALSKHRGSRIVRLGIPEPAAICSWIRHTPPVRHAVHRPLPRSISFLSRQNQRYTLRAAVVFETCRLLPAACAAASTAASLHQSHSCADHAPYRSCSSLTPTLSRKGRGSHQVQPANIGNK